MSKRLASAILPYRYSHHSVSGSKAGVQLRIAKLCLESVSFARETKKLKTLWKRS